MGMLDFKTIVEAAFKRKAKENKVTDAEIVLEMFFKKDKWLFNVYAKQQLVKNKKTGNNEYLLSDLI